MKKTTTKLIFTGLLLLTPFFAQAKEPEASSGAMFYDLNARQTLYPDGVPHTDRQGKRRTLYSSKDSLFPIMLYHPRLTLDYEGKIPTPFDQIRKGGFNAVETTKPLSQELMDQLAKNDLLLIWCNATAEAAKKWYKHPNLFAYDILDEPDNDGDFAQYPSRFAYFKKERDAIREFDPVRPIFVNNVAWIQPPNQAWWVHWQKTSDIGCHDNYAFEGTKPIPSLKPLAESVSLSAAVLGGEKPSWTIIQAYGNQSEQELAKTGKQARFYYPSAIELRAQVYTSLIHGSTGICYYTLDNCGEREDSGTEFGGLGISPNPLPTYSSSGKGRIVSEKEIKMMKDLWTTATHCNDEIINSTPWILSPTSKVFFKVHHTAPHDPTNTPIRALLKEYQGEYRLFMVNLDRMEFKVKVEFPQEINGLKVLYENRNSTPLKSSDNKSIEDHFAPMEAHVYQFKLESKK